jgi:MFS family permease
MRNGPHRLAAPKLRRYAPAMATPRRYGNLVAAIATIAACDVAMGLSFQLLPLILEQRNVSAAMIGLLAAMGPLGILIAGPFLPAVVRRVGSKRLVAVCVVLILATLAGFNLFPSLPAWFALRFTFGIVAGTLFTVSEAWVMTFSEERTRGRVMGLYTSALSVSFAVGPMIIPFTGIDGWMPWLIGMASVALSALPLAFVDVNDDAFKGSHGGGFPGFVKKAPLLLFTVGAVTMVDGILLSFFSIFGLRSGLDLRTVSWILAAGILGNVLAQPVFGLLADKWSRHGVIMLSAAATCLLSVAMVWAVESWLIWPVMIVAGSTAFAAYTVALTTLGDNFKGPDLIAGSAAMSVMWGLGGLIGPPVAGAAVDLFGVNAVPLSIALIFAILLAGLLVTGGKLVRA